MTSYRMVNGTKFLVPSTASDQFMRVFFHVLVPSRTKTVAIIEDEDISAAAYVIQDHWALSHGSPTLENWPNEIQLDEDEIETVLTQDAIDRMKERLKKQKGLNEK